EIDEADDHVFIALEFVDGQTLADLIEEGPLPLRDVAAIAIQIASGLSAAHEHNVVHRDMKSGNVMLTRKGAVKILDFGLAKTAASTKLTQMGSTLGTVAYMSPEQARGEPVDRRSDIWSLGAVLYEMISGKTPFPGDYEQAVIYGILNNDPKPLTSIRTGVPLDLERIVDKCLRKDRDLRYQHADELAADLKSINLEAATHAPVASKSGIARVRSRPLPIAAAAVLALLVGVALGRFVTPDAPTGSRSISSMYRITLEETLELDPSVSPDASMIAYVSGATLNTELFVQHVKGGNPLSVAPIAKGEVAHPAWSPDGSRLAFQNGGSIYFVPALGGTPEPFLLRSQGSPDYYSSPAWSPNGRELAVVRSDSLFVVDVESRERRFLYVGSEISAVVWSPDGMKLAGSAGNQGWSNIHGAFANVTISNVWTYDLASGALTDVTGREYQNDSPAWDGSSIGLYFLSDRGGGMDIYHVTLSEGGAWVEDPTRVTVGLGAHTIATDASGSRIAAAKINLRRNIWRVRIDQNRVVSTREAEQITFGSQLVEAMDISADGAELVYDSNIRGNQDVYLKTIGGGRPIQLTTHEANDFVSTWVDAKNVLIYSLRLGERDVYLLNTESRQVDLILDDAMQVQHPQLSPDGRKLLYRSWDNARDGFSISERADDGSWGIPRFFNATIVVARWSPTGDRICYAGPDGLAIFDLESEDRKYLVTSDRMGVNHARWSKDGSTIYFQAAQPDGSWGIWSIPSQGGTARQLVAFDEPSKMYGFLHIATDEVYLYFTLKEAESDVWMLEVE
ncbi:MAG TPA: protein kinase, partial [Rhodothermia bacterium]|nr:protein kinase [Rhodothermia bacterium]